MTPKLSKAVAAVEKLPQARQDALADLLLEAVARASIDEATAVAELRALLTAAEAGGIGERSMPDLIAAARHEARERGLLGDG
jgi:antitoxin ParD1/3/4